VALELPFPSRSHKAINSSTLTIPDWFIAWATTRNKWRLWQNQPSREYDVFRNLLRDVRIASDVTQVELAKRLKVTQSQVSKSERGEVRLDLVQLRARCQALGVTLPTSLRSSGGAPFEEALTGAFALSSPSDAGTGLPAPTASHRYTRNPQGRDATLS